MDIRYSANQRDVKRYTTEELRKEFLIQNLYQADEVVAVYSHVDRMVTMGCMPVSEKVSIEKGIDCGKNFGPHYFLERREIGIFNIGGKGKITADGQEFAMGYKDCLYITKGTKEVYFESEDPSDPAKFYMVSAPAHTSYTTTFIPIEKAAKRPCGDAAISHKRTIVMKNEEAVISPSWSIQSGAGTSNYTFIWAMGGENMEFDDMDTMKPNEMM